MKKWMIVLCVAWGLFVSCAVNRTVNKAVVSDVGGLKDYAYASIVDVRDKTDWVYLADAEEEVYDALASKGLEMVGEKCVDGLPVEQKEQLLLVRLLVGQGTPSSIFVHVKFLDYRTGKPVAFYKGCFEVRKRQAEADMELALLNVASDIKKLF